MRKTIRRIPIHAQNGRRTRQILSGTIPVSVGPTVQLLNRFVAGLKELYVLRPVLTGGMAVHNDRRKTPSSGIPLA